MALQRSKGLSFLQASTPLESIRRFQPSASPALPTPLSSGNPIMSLWAHR